VTDGGGLSVAGGTAVTATNVSPSLSGLVFTPSSVTDHQTVTVSGTFQDPGTADTFTATFDWGDGNTSSQSLTAGTRSFSAPHDYVTAGSYNVTVTVTDRDSGVGTQSASLVVSASNTPPSGLSLSSNVTGLSATVSGSFTDPDPLDTHDVTILWGDGTTSASTVVAGVTSFSATHTYLAAGTFAVTVTVTDPAGAAASATTSVVATVPASTPSEIVDQMSALVSSFGLSDPTQSWLLRKLDNLQVSLASDNSQVCSSTGTLMHLMAFAQRNLTTDQFAALNDLAIKLEVAASCSGAGPLTPRGQRPSRPALVTTATTVKTGQRSTGVLSSR